MNAWTMNAWKYAARAVLSIGHHLNRRVVRRVRARLFGWRPAFVVPFVGHVVGNRLLLHGRVLRSGAMQQSSAADSRWRNLRNTFRLFATHQVSDALVGVSFGGVDADATTNQEGYFDVDVAPVSAADGPLWQSARVELLRPRPRDGATVDAPVLVHPMTARFGVISDIDDTVVTTHVTSRLRMLGTVLFSNAHTRLPFEGIAALYRALESGRGAGEHNPIFYVSNGPWNMHDLLVEFFRLNDIPLGPMYLRDFGHHLLLPDEPAGAHKRAAIDRILREFPDMRFVLIGDSGERDPEIYVDVALRHPQRVCAIYIRRVHRRGSRGDELARLGAALQHTETHFVLAADSGAAAADAVQQRLIPPEALAAITADMAAGRA
jgi:phosphatidate phosphatase APP1